MNFGEIPSRYYLPLQRLRDEHGMSSKELKIAAQHGGVLQCWRSPKTRRVFYKSKNMELFNARER